MAVLFGILYVIVIVLYLKFRYGSYETQEAADIGKKYESLLFKVILVMMIIYAVSVY